MRLKLLTAVYVFLAGPILNWSLAQSNPTAIHAVCRQESHGASCTVIWTGPGKSYLLGCGHAYPTKREVEAPISLDVPTAVPPGKSKTVRPKLVALDRAADLSLIELPDGPVSYIMPVAPEGFQPGRLVRSIGYDGMRLPGQAPEVHLTLSFTRERPSPGRSGGALCDVTSGYLIGVCQGYEVRPNGRGMYIDHKTIIAFLRRNNYGWLVTDSVVQSQPRIPEVVAPQFRYPGLQPSPLPCPT